MKRGTTAAAAHGKWPTNCPVCGCPGVVTRNDDDPEHERTVWAWDMNDAYLAKIRRLEAIIKDGMSHEDLKRLRDIHDPGFRMVEETQQDWKEEE